MSHNIQSQYLKPAFSQAKRKELIDYAVKQLRKVKDLFDFIVVRGNSGLLIGPSVADRLNKPFGVVRKPSEKSHCWHIYEGALFEKSGRYIIIDDLIDSGDTIVSIVETMNEYKAVCVGCYFYKVWFSYSTDIKTLDEYNSVLSGIPNLGPFYTISGNPCSPNEPYAEGCVMLQTKKRMLAAQPKEMV